MMKGKMQFITVEIIYLIGAKCMHDAACDSFVKWINETFSIDLSSHVCHGWQAQYELNVSENSKKSHEAIGKQLAWIEI